MSIRTYFDRAVATRPDHPAAQYRGADGVESRSYGEMAERVSTIAELAGTLQLVPGKTTIAMILDNSPEWLQIYLGHAGCGFVVVPIDPKLRSSEVSYMLQDAGVMVIYTDKRHLSMLKEIVGELPALQIVILVDATVAEAEAATCGNAKIYALAERMAALAKQARGANSFYRQHVAGDDDVASIIYTSGTTGLPKGALLTHGNFCADAEGCLDLIKGVNSDDRFMIVLPLFHSFSFTTNFVVALCLGATMQFNTNLRHVGEDLKLFSPTILMAVPLLVEKMYAKIEHGIKTNPIAQILTRIGLRSVVGRGVRRTLGGAIRLIVVGGAPCSKKILHGMRKLGIPIIEGYGLTEASPVVTVTTLDSVRPGTIGVPLPNIEIRIADPDKNGVGELQVRGPIVTQGYYNNPGATTEAFDGPWLRTGDLAVQDKDGHLSIRGRKKALIVNREGKNIYPEEVEVCISRDRRILDVVVIGYSENGETGEKVGAIVVPDLEYFKGDSEAPDWPAIEKTTRAIVARQCQALASYKHPRKVEVRREPLERTSIQKVRRHVYQGALDA